MRNKVLTFMITTNAQNLFWGRTGMKLGAILGCAVMAAGAGVPAQAATDLGKKACAKEARTLCPTEMKSMSRKKVEACMIAKVEQTSPVCKAAMYRIKAQREAPGKR